MPDKTTAALSRPDSIDTSFSVCREYLKLTKPRITTLIVISTAVGFYFGQSSPLLYLSLFINSLLGTALMAAGAATLNQWYERDVDVMMNRTRHRPLARRTISPLQALIFGIALSIAGFAELWFFANALAACLSLITSIGYLYFYTPLKRKSPVCTTIGAIPGAIPPLIGFAAASGTLSLQAWILFGILFLWQFPHFYAISWMYKEDYARAGIKMLPVVHPDGRGLAVRILSTLLLLFPVSVAPMFVQMTGRTYGTGAIVLDLTFLYFGVQVAKQKTYSRARQLLWASILYLPLLFALLILDRP